MLESGGRMGGYIIHTRIGLSPSEERRAAQLGPSAVTGAAPPEELARSAGFRVTLQEDVTDDFYDTGAAIVRARERLEADLRAAEGHGAYEEEQAKKRRYVQGIREGLLERSLLIAVKD